MKLSLITALILSLNVLSAQDSYTCKFKVDGELSSAITDAFADDMVNSEDQADDASSDEQEEEGPTKLESINFKKDGRKAEVQINTVTGEESDTFNFSELGTCKTKFGIINDRFSCRIPQLTNPDKQNLLSLKAQINKKSKKGKVGLYLFGVRLIKLGTLKCE